MPDTKFFTNSESDSLLQRFQESLHYAHSFDVLVGYFRSSGFRVMADALNSVEKIRILVGLNSDVGDFEREKGDLIERGHAHQIIINTFCQAVRNEYESSPDSEEIEISAKLFSEWLKAGKIEIRGHPSRNIHAKVYIMRYANAPIYGSVITGSSNFSYSGLSAQREFNVELKDRADIDFALERFEELWNEGVQLNDTFLVTASRDTWLNDQITPYELYLKLLYEYFQEDINIGESDDHNLPEEFLPLEYQRQAVVSAHRILETHRGVFLSDVVGLGKTFISAMLLSQLTGHKLIIVPPVLREYWRSVLTQFGVSKFKVESSGQVERLAELPTDQFNYVLVDEAHRFRNELTLGYEHLKSICQNKKVILVSATPLSNNFGDILSQLKLFQAGRQSTIPGVPDLNAFFRQRQKEVASLRNQPVAQATALKKAAALVRDKVLKHIMVRRTRAEVATYFADDLAKKKLSFPKLAEPRRLIYEFNQTAEDAFNLTIDLLPQLNYARHAPLLYLKTGLDEQAVRSQTQIKTFMKMILVKRLESSLFAFRSSLKRFIESIENYIKAYDMGAVYVGRVDVGALLEADEDELATVLEKKGAREYSSEDFTADLRLDLASDLKVLNDILAAWQTVNSDSKKESFIAQLSSEPLWQSERLLVFTESLETAADLYDSLECTQPDTALVFSSQGGKVDGRNISTCEARELILRNFDPTHPAPMDKYKILIATDVLAEGVNLHRAGHIINYDLPWNPTKVMQRVGRINRVGSAFSEIFVWNFFPTSQADTHLGLEANISKKINAFHTVLGDDLKYLSEDEEPTPQGLFGERLVKGLSSINEDEGAENTELKYLQHIRKIRDEEPELFARIKKLPKKSRSCREADMEKMLIFFREGALKRFVKIAPSGDAEDISFLEAAADFECRPNCQRVPLPGRVYFASLNRAKQFLESQQLDDLFSQTTTSSKERQILNTLRALQRWPGLTEEDDAYLARLYKNIENASLPKAWLSKIKDALKAAGPVAALSALRKVAPFNRLTDNDMVNTHKSDSSSHSRHVILAQYFRGMGEPK